MKVIFTFLLFVLAGVHIYAQHDAKVIAEIAAGNDKTIKGAPFSAEAISESVQVLADGNRIVRNSTSKLYRNSEGRFRREMSGGSGGLFGTTFSLGEGATILDPVAGHRVMLDALDRTARVVQFGSGQGVTIARGGGVASIKELTAEQKAELEQKLANAKGMSEAYRAKLVELQQKGEELRASSNIVAVAPEGQTVTAVGSGGTYAFSTSAGLLSKYDTRTEELGTQNYEGVEAEGTRRVTTIPAGAIGNERPIEIVYERWYSKELGIVVYSKHSDPRFGEQTYRVTNIVRAEPDPSLFTVPNGYKVVSEPGSVYRLKTKPTPAQSAVSTRPAQVRTPSVVNVKATKP